MTLENLLGELSLDETSQDILAEATAVNGKTPTLESGRVPVNITATRRDDDTTVADGEAHPLFSNPRGRLKVSTEPGAIEAVTGNIIAIQPVIGTPVAGATVAADVTRASNVMLHCTGTFAGVNCAFEGSIDGGTTWFGIQAVRTNANTVETTTGSLSAAPIYAWEASVNAMTHVRVRATARTSGTQVWRILPGVYATEPIPAIQTHPVTGSGTFTTTTAAGTSFNLNSAATTNLTSVKTTAGTLFNVTVSNMSGATVFLKLYNKASAPVLASDIPVMVVPVPAASFYTADFGQVGERFASGIAYAITGAAGDTDTTAIAAGVKIKGTYI